MSVESVEKSGRAEVLALYAGYLVNQRDVAGSTTVSDNLSDWTERLMFTRGLRWRSSLSKQVESQMSWHCMRDI
jgi:hypothetical protein